MSWSLGDERQGQMLFDEVAGGLLNSWDLFLVSIILWESRIDIFR